MANVYSTQMVSEAGFSGGPLDAYTPPPGRIAVVKNLTITWGIITISGFDGWFQSKSSLAKLARYTWFTSTTSLTNNGGTQQWWGMWVLEPGEILQIQTVDGTGDFTANGYELTLP